MFLTKIKDVDLKIISLLDDKSLTNLFVSNPKDDYLKSLSNNENFWRNRTNEKFPEFKGENCKGKEWKRSYLIIVRYLNKYIPNLSMIKLSKGGMENIDLIQYFISKGAHFWDTGMGCAAEEGHKDLVEFFISKGANYWNWGMRKAAKGGHKDLVNFFISKGADIWNEGMYCAAQRGDKDLVEFFIDKGVKDWNSGMFFAAHGGHKDLVNFFISKGANDWNWGMKGAAEEGHKDLVKFFKKKIDL